MKSLQRFCVISIVCLLHCYQWLVSPLKPVPSCRFTPSCSAYAVVAFKKHGIIRGGWLTVRRVTRCHPWGGSGVDEVPDTL